MKNQGIYAMLYTADREILYQALLFETIRWNFMNGGDRYGIIPVLRTRRVESMHAPPMPNASEKHHLIQTVLYPMKRIHISA